jgi:hypothetical protein
MTHRLFSNQKKWTIKSLVIASVCAIIPTSTSFAASDFTPGNAIGAKALLFTFKGLSDLGAGAFNGGVGGKYFLQEKMAIRGDLQFTTSSQSQPYNGAGTGSDSSASGTTFGLSLGMEYFLAKARLSPFIGGGIGFSTTSTTQKSPVASPTAQPVLENAPITVKGIEYIPGLGFDIFGLCGVEFFITQEISLALEYQLGYFLKSRSDIKGTQGTTTQTLKMGSESTFGIRYGGFVTLAFYF